MTHTDFSTVIKFRSMIVDAVTCKLHYSEHRHYGDDISAMLCDTSYRVIICEIAKRLQGVPLYLWEHISKISDDWVWEDVITECRGLYVDA